MIDDLNQLPAGAQLQTDVCVIGAGPAGISLALDLAERGLSVVLLESGQRGLDAPTQALSQGRVTDEALHSPPDKYRLRQLGGASAIWGGRCMPLDPLDFELRPQVPLSGWPISHTDLLPFYPAANALAEAGRFAYSAADALGPDAPPMIRGFASSRVSSEGLERFSCPTNFGERYARRLALAPRLQVLLGANCTGLRLASDGHSLSHVSVASLAGRHLNVHARATVLATGGLETARLLLASRDVLPAGVGNTHDAVGRYYMCHLAGNVGQLQVHGRPDQVRHGYEVSPDGVYCRRRLAVVATEQARLGLANMVARLHFARITDPAHGSGVLSGLFLARHFVPYEYAKRLSDSAPQAGDTLRHAFNVLRDPLDAAGFAAHWLARRTLAERKFPSVILRNRSNRFSLEIHAEQRPLAHSRVTLTEQRDALGLPQLQVDWRYSPDDIDSVRRSLDLMAQEFGASGAARLQYNADTLEQDLLRFGAYGGHHLGTARMGRDARSSVVNADCQVHGVRNLFVAGSAVFPTSSQANPTLTIIALALRLGATLGTQLSRAPLVLNSEHAPLRIARERTHVPASAGAELAVKAPQESLPETTAVTHHEVTVERYKPNKRNPHSGETTPLKVLVLGGSGYIGRRWQALQVGNPAVEVVAASRHAPPGPGQRQLDSRDLPALTHALQGMDAVLNCVAGSSAAIAEGARVLCLAAQAAGGVRVVHLSTQSVYGAFEGQAYESMPLDPGLGWYGSAKCQAEQQLRDWVRQDGGQAVVLRPGCVWGPGSQLWVGRVARWLQAGRLGDLGAGGDGWSNLVHVDDVCQALSAALRLPMAFGELPTFNLAAPDSPRWNRYFTDLALAVHATPLRRVGQRQLHLDAWLAGPPLKLGQRLLQAAPRQGRWLQHWPDPLPPNLPRLWRQQIQLNTEAASKRLGLRWTPYAKGLAQSVAWLLQEDAPTADRLSSCAT